MKNQKAPYRIVSNCSGFRCGACSTRDYKHLSKTTTQTKGLRGGQGLRGLPLKDMLGGVGLVFLTLLGCFCCLLGSGLGTGGGGGPVQGGGGQSYLTGGGNSQCALHPSRYNLTGRAHLILQVPVSVLSYSFSPSACLLTRFSVPQRPSGRRFMSSGTSGRIQNCIRWMRRGNRSSTDSSARSSPRSSLHQIGSGEGESVFDNSRAGGARGRRNSGRCSLAALGRLGRFPRKREPILPAFLPVCCLFSRVVLWPAARIVLVALALLLNCSISILVCNGSSSLISSGGRHQLTYT